MTFCAYILYSPALDKFYVGSTHDMESRLSKHLANYYGKSFSSRATDWEIYLRIACDNEAHARRVENHIKKMKSGTYYQSLKSVSGLSQKLADRFRVTN